MSIPTAAYQHSGQSSNHDADDPRHAGEQVRPCLSATYQTCRQPVQTAVNHSLIDGGGAVGWSYRVLMEEKMARQEFRNQFNKLMGWRQKQGDHDVGYDYLGRIKGYYEPRCDVTKDVFGQVVSRGDTLSSLIFTR